VQGRFMRYGRASAFWILGLVVALTLPAGGQSVISTHSGTVHFFEGAVYLGDQPLQSHLGKFTSIPQGGELRTVEGRAEVLLTPGVIIRIGERTTIRLLANQLSDTRVELLAGSVIVDSSEPAPGTLVTLLYKNWSTSFPEQGIYRIDSEPPCLWVFQGKAEVSAGNKDGAILVGQGMDMPFAPVLVPSRFVDHPRDALSIWAEGRRQSISADNTIAANIQDPASIAASNPMVDSFTYFPMLGLPSLGPSSSGIYGSLATYEPGFNSIYLPGYNYLPTYTLLPYLLGLGRGGLYPTTLRPPVIGRLPILPSRTPIGSPIVHPVSPHPIPIRPVSPSVPVHPTARAETHVGVHR